MSGNRRKPRPARPFVVVNMAMTADGKIATANRAVSSFGSKQDHDHLLALRATADAVMAGARTVDSAKINLGPGGQKFQRLRVRRNLAEFNLRIVVTGDGSLDSKAHIFQHRFSPIIILTTQRASVGKLKHLRVLASKVKICGRDEINFHFALRWLRQEWGVTRLVCEGGGDLNDAMFRAGLADEIHLTICPRVFGGRKSPTIAEGQGVASLALAAQFEFKSVKRIGNELFTILRRRDSN